MGRLLGSIKLMERKKLRYSYTGEASTDKEKMMERESDINTNEVEIKNQTVKSDDSPTVNRKQTGR